MKAQIDDEMSTLNDRIASNQDATTRENEQREQDLADYNEKVQEHQDGINACEEAIGLVTELINSSPSLIQIRKAKNSVANIQKKLGKKNQYSPLIKALTQLALDQNFSDQDTVEKIVELLNNLKDNLTTSLQTLNNAEDVAAQESQQRLAQLADELTQLQATLDQRTLDLQTTNSNFLIIEVFLYIFYKIMVAFVSNLMIF